MKKQNGIIGIRISQEQKNAVKQFVREHRFKNLSHAVRTALEQFLNDE